PPADQIVDHLDLDLLDLEQMLPLMVDQLIELVADRAHLEFGLEVDLVVVLGPHAIARLLPVLAHHDDRRLDRRQQRQGEIEQNVRIRIKGMPQQIDAIDEDPYDHHTEENEDKTPAAAEFGNFICGALAEGETAIELAVDVVG